MRIFKTLTLATVLTGVLLSCTGNKEITLETLLDEMVSFEAATRCPEPYYTCHQQSSYDRLSVSPDSAHWFANADGFGVIRTDTVKGRIENVMFDEKGPGVITRIWITTIDKRGTWRFYFDGDETPGWVIPAYDLMCMGISSLGKGLLQPHTSYTPGGKGGNTLFLPIPYAQACKITFEDAKDVAPTPKYYGINYRKYAENTAVETFSEKVVSRADKKIREVNNLLLNPVVQQGITINATQHSDTLEIILPDGENAVNEVTFRIAVDSANYGQVMRQLIFSAEFDDKQTVWVPLSDFSGGGMGAPSTQSWYLSSDGAGNISCRWMMPYKGKGVLKLTNLSGQEITGSMQASVIPYKWEERSLYFHASWRQERNIYIHDKPEEGEFCADWNFATIEGKGIYMGDVLSLFNHAPAWYGEGDEKIWVDDDTFPSHFGTGTEDYYNSSWAPVIPFQTPFGGAPRADLASSHGYNTFFRTRNLDGIPFMQKFKFDIEMIGWIRGYVDYATTIYWYGDYHAKAMGTSGVDEAKMKLLPAPENPATYKIENSIEFEDMAITAKSPSINIDKQNMFGFPHGKWSQATQLTGHGGNTDDFVEFTMDGLKDGKYKLVLYSTMAIDYGKISFMINDHPTNIVFDAYNEVVTNSKPISLGVFGSESGKIKLKVQIIGTNPESQGSKYMFGLDCLQLMAVKSKR